MTTRRQPRSRQSAFTLLELLIAMSISLVMLFAVIRFLEWMGTTVSDGRAMIELTSQLRAVRQRLHDDLASLTVPVRPYADNGGAQGYFMIFEGVLADLDRDADGDIDSDTDNDGIVDIPTALSSTPWGDYDDVIAFTIHSRNEPLMGQTPNGMSQAENAEVIWFTGWDDTDQDGVPDIGEIRYLFRRQLLVDPNLMPATITSTMVSPDPSRGLASVPYPFPDKAKAVDGWHYFQQNYDLSVHIEPRYTSMGTVQDYILVGNTLSDLARRENRFAHFWNQAGNRPADGFPNQFDLDPTSTPSLGKYVLQGTRTGEDVQLSRCIAWDVRVYDPQAVVVQQTNNSNAAALDLDAAGPSDRLVDPTTVPTTGVLVSGYGAFVDLNYLRYTPGTSLFSGPSSPGSQLINAIYDTWSITYERDGINQDAYKGDMLTDEATNGLDDGYTADASQAANYPLVHSNTSGYTHQNGIDDPSERETIAPYETPLRGVQVLIRVYDPATRQVRQGTVVANFTSE